MDDQSLNNFTIVSANKHRNANHQSSIVASKAPQSPRFKFPFHLGIASLCPGVPLIASSQSWMSRQRHERLLCNSRAWSLLTSWQQSCWNIPARWNKSTTNSRWLPMTPTPMRIRSQRSWKRLSVPKTGTRKLRPGNETITRFVVCIQDHFGTSCMCLL